jgi:hypothetical protein
VLKELVNDGCMQQGSRLVGDRSDVGGTSPMGSPFGIADVLPSPSTIV